MDAENSKNMNLASAFVAGAASVAYMHGMQEKDAEAFVEGVCKEASLSTSINGDEDDTFWSRNKHWLIPAIASSLAFYIGADGERHGRKDRSFLSNAGSRLWDRAKDILHVNRDPLFDAATKTNS